jgi:hypothetical protein
MTWMRAIYRWLVPVRAPLCPCVLIGQVSRYCPTHGLKQLTRKAAK